MVPQVAKLNLCFIKAIFYPSSVLKTFSVNQKKRPKISYLDNLPFTVFYGHKIVIHTLTVPSAAIRSGVEKYSTLTPGRPPSFLM